MHERRFLSRVARAMLALVTLTAMTSCGGTPNPPPSERRIVSLSPSMSEAVWALECGDELVGVTRYCDMPPELDRLRRDQRVAEVGDLFNPNIERILSLGPTLILSERTTHSDKLSKLRDVGADFFALRLESLDDVFAMIRAVGGKLGKSKRAEELVAAVEAELVKPIAAPAPRVLLVYEAANPASVQAIGAKSYQAHVLVRLGGVNALGEVALVTAELGAERMLALDPDMIIELSPFPPSIDVRQRWSELHTLRAVQLNEVHTLHGPQMARLSPSVAGLAKALRAALTQWQERERTRRAQHK